MLATTPAEAEACNLVWTDDRAPGIRRRRRGRGVVYVDDTTGATVRDQQVVARIRSLAVPPAWTDVWICRDPRGHLQATGRDAKGRKQYRYHPSYRAHREATKFMELARFARALPTIRRRVARDLALSGMPKDKVVATVIRLLEATLVRISNEEYARTNGSYGLTTLRDRHARGLGDGTLQLSFVGKHGKEHKVAIHDAKLGRIVRRCRDLPGQVLFQYVNADGDPCPITSADVNDYLRRVSGAPLSAKEFRTWMGTLLAASALAAMPPPDSDRSATAMLKGVFDEVSRHLGNTPTVCRASYVHPGVVGAFRDGTLEAAWRGAAPAGPAGLVADERRLLALIETEAAVALGALNDRVQPRTKRKDRHGRPDAADRPHRAVRGAGRREPTGRRRPHADARGGGRRRAAA